MYIQYGINIGFTPEPDHLLRTRERGTDVSLKTHCLVFLMNCCGINRLFDKTDIEELLFRMGLLLRQHNIINTFFQSDFLLNEGLFGPNYTLKIDDLKAHLGLEISNSPINFIDQGEWLKKYNTYWKNACLTCIFSNSPLTNKVSKPDNEEGRELLKINIELNDINYTNHVALFVTEALKAMGSEPLNLLEQRTKQRQKQLEEFNEKINQKPPFEFDYSKVPLKIKQRFFEHICGPVLKFLDYFNEVSSDSTSNFALLIHLSWLMDNNFVTVYKVKFKHRYSYTAEVDPRMSLNYDDYDGLHDLGYGINLYKTYRSYNLEKLKGLLKENEPNS